MQRLSTSKWTPLALLVTLSVLILVSVGSNWTTRRWMNLYQFRKPTPYGLELERWSMFRPLAAAELYDRHLRHKPTLQTPVLKKQTEKDGFNFLLGIHDRWMVLRNIWHPRPLTQVDYAWRLTPDEESRLLAASLDSIAANPGTKADLDVHLSSLAMDAPVVGLFIGEQSIHLAPLDFRDRLERP